MGTAPGHRQHPAMPDPSRLVTRSVNMLRRLGMNNREALETVVLVARTVRFRASGKGKGYDPWLSQVVNIAETALGSLTPSTPHQQENRHGDGPGSRTGSATQHGGCSAP